MEEKLITFRCRGCKKIHYQRVKGQKYCSQGLCQLARKNSWRRDKYHSDIDYRLNQRKSTQAWLESVGGAAKYYKSYRQQLKQKPPGPVRTKGKENRDTTKKVANRDAILSEFPLNSGEYLMFHASGANRDAIRVKLQRISMG